MCPSHYNQSIKRLGPTAKSRFTSLCPTVLLRDFKHFELTALSAITVSALLENTVSPLTHTSLNVEANKQGGHLDWWRGQQNVGLWEGRLLFFFQYPPLFTLAYAQHTSFNIHQSFHASLFILCRVTGAYSLSEQHWMRVDVQPGQFITGTFTFNIHPKRLVILTYIQPITVN